MAESILTLGLASNFAELEAALWEIDVRVIQQLTHAYGVRHGRKLRWKHLMGSAEDQEQVFDQIEQREFRWPLELR